MAIRLKPDERIEIVYRSSEIILGRTVLIVLVAMYLPWYFATKFGTTGNYRNLLLLWTAAVTVYAVWKYFSWRANQYIITSDRLILTRQEGLFRTTTIETPLKNIRNVSYKTTGLVSTVFDYGNVYVQADGLAEPMTLERVRDPEAIKDYLWELNAGSTQKSGKML